MAGYHTKIFELSQFDTGDIPGLIELSASVGWDYDEKEIGTVLASGEIVGNKNAEGKIVSSAAIIPYDNSTASIGMVIVDKDYRGMGLGKKATKECMERVSKETIIMLITTEEGTPLYESMGFAAGGYVHKYLCDQYQMDPVPQMNSPFTIEAFSNIDFDKIRKLDEGAFGDKRTRFLRNRIKQSEKCLVVKDENGEIAGFGLSISGPVNLILGPVAAPDNQVAFLLIDKLTSGHEGKVRIDVPSGKDEFRMFLEKRGFVQSSQPPVMIINSHTMPSRNNTLFGIAAQVFG